MKILVFGDIFGRVGRKSFARELPILKERYNPDFVVVNIENITSGRGPIPDHAEFIENLGVDLMTGGDHIYDNAPKIFPYLEKEDSILLRPANFYSSEYSSPVGLRYKIIKKNNKRLLVIVLLGEIFMNHKVHNPFLYIEDMLEKEIPKDSYDACIVEFHRETTSELYAMANFLDGRVSMVYGTHTHIQTNDAHILGGGTGIISDVGMNGPFESVIGASYTSVKPRFLSGISKGKIEPMLTGKFLTNAVYLEVGNDGKAIHIENISYTSS